MTPRLILAIISTLLEEAALVVVALLGLPRLGIQIPIAVIIAVMAAWAIISIIIYRTGSKALRREPVVGLPAMVGSKGRVASSLTPEGLITIKGELWQAATAGDKIDAGEDIIVVGQDGLRLIVRKSNISAFKNSE
jgi:membrane-bound ClpP family serine protease